ncbi:membrane-associated protein, putative [Bodo saltans]|uniref:Membrane-associated protein, putative n=1 Tax=Bodo saltans TaxID=75058 RepID=A0A0S4JR40_BODSA|nr:membrane-associated protein, putative [Bodo saltans]|eukprot:CUG94003.1 membrane-associated protein, putative [Bodo saltans]
MHYFASLLSVALAFTFVTAEKATTTTCQSAVRGYLDHRLAVTNASKVVASKRSEMAEAHPCPQHPPSSVNERAMDKIEYLQYCMTWAQRVNEELLAATSTLVGLEENIMTKAVAAKKICVDEAVTASKTPAEFPARFLFVTGAEVLRSIYDDYYANAFVDFTKYLEITVRRGYALYRRLIGRVMTNTKVEDTSFHSASPPPPHSKGNPLFEALAKIARLSIPDHLATAAQLAGIALGPVLVVAVISGILVLFFPIIVGYVLIGRVLFQFWVRALLIEGTFSQLVNQQYASSTLALASKLLSDSPLEVFLFSALAVTLVFVVVVVAFPWCMVLWSLVDIPPSKNIVSKPQSASNAPKVSKSSK